MQRYKFRTKKLLAGRFISFLFDNGKCLEWRGSKSRLGYGRFGVATSKCKEAHIVSYELFVGPIPKGKIIMHICDNPPCVNPRHLVLGTQKDNVQDMLKKGRGHKIKGEAIKTSKLTVSKVKEIREMHSKGISRKEIAKIFLVSTVQIGNIINNKHWK